MPMKKLEMLENAIDSIDAAGIAISVRKGTDLFDEIKNMDRTKSKVMISTF